MVILHFIILGIIFLFASILAWKYSPRFISRRDRYRNSDFKILQIRLGMIATTCGIIGVYYFAIFIHPLVGQNKHLKGGKTSTLDTSAYEQSTIPTNKIKQKNKKETTVIDSPTKSKEDTGKN